MTTLVIYPYILHRTEEIYPNPEEFIPERFLIEENKSKFLFGYLPFSAGARNCVGNKIFIVFINKQIIPIKGIVTNILIMRLSFCINIFFSKNSYIVMHTWTFLLVDKLKFLINYTQFTIVICSRAKVCYESNENTYINDSSKPENRNLRKKRRH